jgi:hypothetical protein
MNLARARRRWRAWDRQLARLRRLSPRAMVATEGMWKAWEQQANLRNRQLERQARRDAKRIVGDVLDAYLRLP